MFLPPGFSIANNGQIYSVDGRGPYPLKEAGFFFGRRFSAFKEFAASNNMQLPNASRLLFRFSVNVDSLVSLGQMCLDNGHVRILLFKGGTSVGTFSPVPIFGDNSTEEVPVYARQNVLSCTPVGGPALVGITDGILFDMYRMKVANAANNSQSANIRQDYDLGLGVGVYYILIDNLGPGIAEGLFKIHWEEVPNS